MSETLRVLVVLPMYGGSLPIGYYCAKALQDLGQQVRIFEAPVFYDTFSNLKQLDLTPEQLYPIERSFLQVVAQAIWAHVQSFEPHLVLAMAQAPLSKTLLTRLKRLGIRTAMWFVEDFELFQYWKQYAPLYDVFAIIQKEPFIQELHKIGQPNVLYLPLAASQFVHKHVTLSDKEQKIYGADVGFLGAGYPNRRLAFRPLAFKNFKIWGSDWEDEELLKDNIQRQGERISTEESVKIYNATTINLNLHSSINTEQLISNGDFVNPRTFELAALQVFQLVDQRRLLPELFDADEIATFATLDEMYNKIEYFLRHPQERTEFIAKAFKKVMAKHTYNHRMESLLSFVDKTLGFPKLAGCGQGQSRQDAYDADIDKLLVELNVGPNVSFQEVVARLRRQSGKLTDLEATILFLDEFHKHYS